jgi:hypothetical protein
MQDEATGQIISQLKTFKQQGLTYYQASQKLKEQGFTDDQISIAGSSYPYTDVVAPSDNNQTLTMVGQQQGVTSSAEVELGTAMLRDKRKSATSSKFFIGVILFVVGFGFGSALMRLYLIPRWFSPAGPNIFTHSSRYNYSTLVRYKYIYPAEAGIAAGLLVVILYSLYNLVFNRTTKDSCAPIYLTQLKIL